MEKSISKTTMNKDSKEISFRDDMIALIASGEKTLTIRPMKPQPTMQYFSNAGKDNCLLYWSWKNVRFEWPNKVSYTHKTPYGEIGDRIAIRERPDFELDITDIRIERLHSIDSIVWGKDGVCLAGIGDDDIETELLRHWDSFYFNTEFSWNENPWCWIVEFEMATQGKTEPGQAISASDMVDCVSTLMLINRKMQALIESISKNKPFNAVECLRNISDFSKALAHSANHVISGRENPKNGYEGKAGLVKALKDFMNAVEGYFGWNDGMTPEDGMEYFIAEYRRAQYALEHAEDEP